VQTEKRAEGKGKRIRPGTAGTHERRKDGNSKGSCPIEVAFGALEYIGLDAINPFVAIDLRNASE
jgi:hypothetical protein